MTKPKELVGDTNFSKILAQIKKTRKTMSEDEALNLAKSICMDAPERYANAAGFGDNPETMTVHEKAFGETTGDVSHQDKTVEVEVVNDEPIEYPNEKGEQELFVFIKNELDALGRKMEGIPIVIGNAHEADLPLAHFTKDFMVKEVEKDGVKRNALYVKARIREDPDSPVVAEDFFKDPSLALNGGHKVLKGSLKFNSKDIAYFYPDGSKMNYMTGTSPRHYALLDSPYVKESGIVNKNFGKEGENTMTETVVAAPQTIGTPLASAGTVVAIKPEAPKVEPAASATAPAVVVTPEVKPEAKAEEAVKVTPVAEVVPKSEYDGKIAELDTIKAKLAEIEKKYAASERGRMVEKIVIKKFGVDYSDKDAKDFEEKELKAFGVGELTAYLAAMSPGTSIKSLGRGKVDTSSANPGAQKLELSFFKNKAKKPTK